MGKDVCLSNDIFETVTFKVWLPITAGIQLKDRNIGVVVEMILAKDWNLILAKLGIPKRTKVVVTNSFSETSNEKRIIKSI